MFKKAAVERKKACMDRINFEEAKLKHHNNNKRLISENLYYTSSKV